MKPLFIIAAMFVLLGLRVVWAETPPEAALARLQEGNRHYGSGQTSAPGVTAGMREELAAGQHPFACVVTCSDSRVPPELLFDQSLGQLFVVRVAGNVISPEVVGSVEYAVEHLHTPLVVVLGHSGCGAVHAALAEEAPAGAVGALVARIQPAIRAAREKGYGGDELPDATVREHARRGAETLLAGSRVLDDAVRHGELRVLSAIYDLHSGDIAWQTQLSAPPALAAAAPPSLPAPVADVHPASPPEPPALLAPTPPAPSQVVEPSSSYARRHR